MRLKHLKINNFRVLRTVDIALPDEVIGVIGPNGAGKSSLVEAIAWALYGHQAARSGKSEIKSQAAAPDDNCAVELQFELNGQSFRINRKLIGRTERGEVELFRGDQQEAVGVAVTRDYMTELLGLDIRGFLTSFLARQQELNTLSDLTPAERRNHLAGMMGVGQLDKAIQVLKGDIKGFGDKIDYIERQLAARDDLKARLEETSTRLSRLKPQRDVLAQQSTESRQQLVAAEELARRWQDKKSAHTELTSRLKSDQVNLKDLSVRSREVAAEIEELVRLETERAALEQSTRGLKAARSRLEQLRQSAANESRRKDLEKQKAQLERRRQTLSRELEDGRKYLAEVIVQLKAIPEDVTEQLRQARVELEAARDQYSGIREQRGGIEAELNKLKGQVGHIAELGPQSICDRCRRPLGDDLPQIRRHLNEEQKGLQARLDELNRQLSRSATEGKQLSARVADLENKHRQQGDLVTRRQSLQEQAAGRQEQIEDMNDRIRQADAELKSMGETEFNPHDLAVAEKTLAGLEADRRKLDELSGRLQRLPVARAEHQNLQKRRRQSDSSIADLGDRLAAIGFDSEAAALADQALKESQEKAERAREQLIQADKELQLAERDLAHLASEREKLTQAERELNVTQENRFYGEKLSGLMTRFRAELVAGIRPRLADLSSGLFDEMTGGKYNLVELDEKYNLRILDNGQFFGVERFSGGEKDLANLCLRLSISRSLTDSAGLDRSFVILDEVFGSQDNERRDLIIEALTRLRHRFPQILLITHIEEIRNRVGRLIEVTPTGRGYSEVRVA